MSVQISKKKQILFGIIVLIIILGGIEAAANIWWYGLNTCPFEDSELYSHLDNEAIKTLCIENLDLNFMTDRISSMSGDTIQINSQGFRGAEFSIEKPFNTYRIIVLGGSTTFGTGVFDDQTIDFYLEREFAKNNFDFKVEVINAGLGGAWSKTETALIKEKLVNYNPDLIIAYDGWNDALKQNDHILDFDSEATENLWKDRWVDICMYGETKDFETVVVLQPILGSGKRLLTDQEYTNYLVKQAIQRDTIKTLESYSEQLDEIGDSCAAAVDFREIFNEIQEPVFWDIGHVGAHGNQIISNSLYQLILPIVLENKILNNEFETQIELQMEIKIVEKTDESIFSFYKTLKVIGYILSGDNRFSSTLQQDLDLRFKGKDLTGKDFTDRDLQNSVFYYSILNNVNFQGANLKESNFHFAKLNNVNFEKANLEGTDFRLASLTDVDFKDAITKDVNFPRTKIKFTNLSELNLHDSNFVGSTIEKSDLSHTNFENSNFQGAFIFDSKLRNVNFKNSDFTKARFYEVDFTTVDITGAIFKDTLLWYADLSEMDFSIANFEAVRLAGSYLFNVNLKNTDLSGFDFSGKGLPDAGILLQGTIIKKVDLSNRDLTKTIFVTPGEYSVDEDRVQHQRLFAASIIDSNLSSADLSNVNLSYVFFEDVDLSNTDLSNANLFATTLKNVDLSNANLNGADLTIANLENVVLDGAALNCVGHEICNNN